MDQWKTPLYDALAAHTEKKPVSFHVPGHKNGNLFEPEADQFFSGVLKLDVTELTGLDDLHSPEGAILEAETLLAGLFGVKKSIFLINGSTSGNLAMILAAVQEDETILVQRNSHKSIVNGITLAKAKPVFLGPAYDEQWGVAGGVDYETVQTAIEQFPHAKALILTYPNYYGMVFELQKIIKLTHGHNIPVLIDEAHGAHFIAGNPFPPSAVQLGADIVVQSAHKTLPAMTMGSFLHFNSRLISLDAIAYFLQVLQSSSPSYPIMASLDLARRYIATFTKEDADVLIGKIQFFKEMLSAVKGIKVLPYPNGLGDPIKITLQSTSLLSGFEIQKRFEKAGIYTELADPHNILLILPLLKQTFEYPFDNIFEKMSKALTDISLEVENKQKIYFQKPVISEPALHLKDRASLTYKEIPLSEAAGKIAAEMIIPYPPGIPLLYPGEAIRAEDVGLIRAMIESGTRFQGGEVLKQDKILVYL